MEGNLRCSLRGEGGDGNKEKKRVLQRVRWRIVNYKGQAGGQDREKYLCGKGRTSYRYAVLFANPAIRKPPLLQKFIEEARDRVMTRLVTKVASSG